MKYRPYGPSYLDFMSHRYSPAKPEELTGDAAFDERMQELREEREFEAAIKFCEASDIGIAQYYNKKDSRNLKFKPEEIKLDIERNMYATLDPELFGPSIRPKPRPRKSIPKTPKPTPVVVIDFAAYKKAVNEALAEMQVTAATQYNRWKDHYSVMLDRYRGVVKSDMIPGYGKIIRPTMLYDRTKRSIKPASDKSTDGNIASAQAFISSVISEYTGRIATAISDMNTLACQIDSRYKSETAIRNGRSMEAAIGLNMAGTSLIKLLYTISPYMSSTGITSETSASAYFKFIPADTEETMRDLMGLVWYLMKYKSTPNIVNDCSFTGNNQYIHPVNREELMAAFSYILDGWPDNGSVTMLVMLTPDEYDAFIEYRRSRTTVDTIQRRIEMLDDAQWAIDELKNIQDDYFDSDMNAYRAASLMHNDLSKLLTKVIKEFKVQDKLRAERALQKLMEEQEEARKAKYARMNEVFQDHANILAEISGHAICADDVRRYYELDPNTYEKRMSLAAEYFDREMEPIRLAAMSMVDGICEDMRKGDECYGHTFTVQQRYAKCIFALCKLVEMMSRHVRSITINNGVASVRGVNLVNLNEEFIYGIICAYVGLSVDIDIQWRDYGSKSFRQDLQTYCDVNGIPYKVVG